MDAQCEGLANPKKPATVEGLLLASFNSSMVILAVKSGHLKVSWLVISGF